MLQRAPEIFYYERAKWAKKEIVSEKKRLWTSAFFSNNECNKLPIMIIEKRKKYYWISNKKV